MSGENDARTIAGVLLGIGSLVAGAVLVALAIRGDKRKNRPLEEAWREVAGACRIEEIEVRRTLLYGRVLLGRRGIFTVRLAPYRTKWAEGTRFVVEGPPSPVSLRWRQGVLRSIDPRPGVPTHDPAFDGAIEVAGPPTLARALLDAKTRRLALACLSRPEGADAHPRGLRMGSRLRAVRLSGVCLDLRSHASKTEVLRVQLGDALELARRLSPPDNVVTRLARNAQSDPVAEVRLANLAALVEEHSGEPETIGALRAAMEDRDERLRLTGAVELGPAEGQQVLRAIARDPASGDTVAARAVTELGTLLPADEAEEVLADALRDGRHATMSACLDSLARRGGEHLAPVVRVLAEETSVPAVAAADALGRSGAAAAEAALIRALAHPVRAVRAAAVVALGRVGTVAAVVALREAEGDADPNARAAVAAIQSRLVGAEQGQLALTQPAGELSLAEDARGRVSRDEER